MSKTNIDEIESALNAGHKVEVGPDGTVAIKDAVPPRPIQFMYTNYKGERGYRTIIPLGWTWSQGNEWHPEPQWLLEGHDVDKDEHRSFALNDMGKIDGRFGTRPGISQAFDELRASVGGALDHIDPLADPDDDLQSLEALRDQAFDLARKLAEVDGYLYTSDNPINTCDHPRAQGIWRRVCTAFDALLCIDIDDVLQDLAEEER